MKLRLAVATVMFTLCFSANAATSCSESYVKGTTPPILNPRLRVKTQAICYSGYATMHSGITRTPLWSAEHLDRSRIERACALRRDDRFHPDPYLPVADRAELADYARSGYDRGHMAPSADMPTEQAQEESFSLANMVPQVHANNAGIWERLETGARNLAQQGHDVYVVSGPLFEGAELKQLRQRVMVPTGLFKAIYDATTNQAGAYVISNGSDQSYTLSSVDELSRRAGIDVFPTLPAEVKAVKREVITPQHRTHCPDRR